VRQLADPTGIHTFRRRDLRRLKIHAFDRDPHGVRYPLCASRGRGLRFSYYGEVVDCRICLYRLGLYVPLLKLREHQATLRAAP
jgi:hypothetical protein